MRITIILICIFLTSQSISQNAFSAVLQKTDQELVYLYSVPFEEVKNRNQSLSAEGFELIDLEFHDASYWAIWKHSGHQTTMQKADSWEAFQEIKKQKIKDGQLLNNLLVYKNDEGQYEYIGLWKNKRLAHNIWKLPNLKAIQFHYKEMAKLSLYLHDIQVVEEENGKLAYFVLYHKGSPSEMTHFTQFANESAFNQDHAKRIKSGYQPIDIEVKTIYGIPQYFCLYRKVDVESELQYQLDWEGLVNYQEFLGADYKVVDLEFSEGKRRIFAPPFNLKRVEGTPDSDMEALQLTAKGSSAPSIKNQSAAFAAANGLYWLSQNGFSKLADKKSGKADQECLKIARKLAGANHMKTLLPTKSNKYTVIEGLSKYIEEDYEVEEISYFDIEDFDTIMIEESLRAKIYSEDSLSSLPLKKAKEGVIGSTIVLLRWGQYEPSADGKNLIKKGDYWGTLVGYGKNKHEIEKPNYILVHDPSDGNEAQQKYFRVDELEKYFSTTDQTMLLNRTDKWKDEAEDYHSISAVKRQLLSEFEEGAENIVEFPVWEGLLIIKVK